MKLVGFDNLKLLAAELHEQKRKLVTTNGCFDLLHWGHIHYLNEARKLGDVLICGINSDASVRALKGKNRPIFPQRIRANQVAALQCVDYVTIFHEKTPERFLQIVRPAVHVKGGDYVAENLPERACVEENGGKVLCLPLVEGFSTTSILKLLSQE